MVDGDIFREVEEELRREQFAKLWDRYGTLILGAALAIILSVAGYQYWTYQQAEQAQTYGARFVSALDLAADNKKELAELSFSQIAEEGPRGYAMLARIRKAALQAASGKQDSAVEQYDALANDAGVDPVLQDFSRIEAAMLRIDKADEAEMKRRLGKLAEGTSSWRHSARELLGLAAFRAGHFRQAESRYSALLADRSAPAGLKKRAEMMLNVILERTADKDGAAGKSAGKATPRSYKIPAHDAKAAH